MTENKLSPFFDIADPAFSVTATGRAPHFGFGGGIHYCLGHYVARADMGTALTVLAGRLRDPRPAGEAIRLPDSGNTGPVRLPIAFTADEPAWFH
jgi:cytochrome P450